jgi:hypothetical protein
MHALLSIPVPVLPNAFLYEVAFASILGAVLALVAVSPSLRRRQFAVVLIPIGIIEFFILAYYSYYTIPAIVFIIPFITILSGIIVPIFYATRRMLSKKGVKFLLVFSGCVELALGVIRLLYIRYWELPELYPSALLATVGIYSLAIGTFLIMAKPK